MGPSKEISGSLGTAIWGGGATATLALPCRPAASRPAGGHAAGPAGRAAAAGQRHCTAHYRCRLAPLAGTCTAGTPQESGLGWGPLPTSWLCPYSPFHPLQMMTPGPAPEGYVVLYRCLLPVGTAWSQQDVGRELSAVIPVLRRGYQYEFKVRPYARGAWGLDSNSWHLWIPEEGTLGWWVGCGGQWRSRGSQHCCPGSAERGAPACHRGPG